ncbi:N-acetylmuramoyl-L-alanine amidase [Pontibacter akesuensis]|uniref:N-acetylmuramoyl-L-alanine amidase n=1 Tax=Pontibacter akesuensis TaxID=388950 RepID=A0A1I7GP04_9BACT|nr:N-acetylmuramoyl-L-alanine amidase [Pontibacter akesuensis]GHA55748.1 N-acetylmuramoyl-L-alanine amidase [Pontibacter akesuensis]SFU50185.1 N-acetylmuramoyl-L-alanine amidase [Pontibacter akesuensis]
MKYSATTFCSLLLACASLASCSNNPYASTNRSHKKQVKELAKQLRTLPATIPGEEQLQQGDYWVGTTNLGLRRPNLVIIHHTAQHSTEQTLDTFTKPQTQVSSHYVIGRDGKVYHMLNDNLRAWHAGNGRWGNDTDINSSSIGIELDNNGAEPFSDAQVNSLLQVLALLKETHRIPTANFIGHADIAPTRKSDPNRNFPWKKLAAKGYGLWYDEGVVEKYLLPAAPIALLDSTGAETGEIIQPQDSVSTIPLYFNPREALRIIGYDTSDMPAAIRAFKLHFIQEEVNEVLTEKDKIILYNLYQKYL